MTACPSQFRPGPNSGSKAWRQAFLPAEPSAQSKVFVTVLLYIFFLDNHLPPAGLFASVCPLLFSCHRILLGWGGLFCFETRSHWLGTHCEARPNSKLSGITKISKIGMLLILFILLISLPGTFIH